MSLDENDKKRALEEREKTEGAQFDTEETNDESSEPKSLGKAETHDQKENRRKLEDHKDRVKQETGADLSSDIHVSIGYTEIPSSSLPSLGRFYPNKASIQIRAAKGQELEHWTTMNEDNPIDVDKHFKDIIASCVKFKIGSRPVPARNLLEADKLFVLLKIQEKTFDEDENKVVLSVECSKCGTKNKKKLEASSLEIAEDEDNKIETYYDSENKRYSVKTKSFGEVHLYPPTIGTMEFVYDYVTEKMQSKQYYSKGLMQLLPYLVEDYSDLTEKDIIMADTDFKGWDKKKISLIYRLVEMIKVGIKPNLKFNCTNCGSKEETPVRFPDGPKSLFLISDIEDELL